MATVTETRPAVPTVARSNRQLIERIVLYLIMILIALIFLIPLAWMLSTSFKIKAQLFSIDVQWIPKTFTWDNYTTLLNNDQLPVGRWFINSLLLAGAQTILVLVLDSLAAYAYARMEFRGKNVLFALLLATLFLPGLMFLVPNFLTIHTLGLLNNYLGVIIPGLAGIFGVFLLRQFFESIPKELEEAAVIDGANIFQTFWRVILPLARPALATLAVITFLGAWNDLLWPLLILQDPQLLTLPPGLAQLQGAYTSEYGQMMAGAVITAVPVLVIYIALQRFIVQSVATTGLKG